MCLPITAAYTRSSQAEPCRRSGTRWLWTSPLTTRLGDLRALPRPDRILSPCRGPRDHRPLPCPANRPQPARRGLARGSRPGGRARAPLGRSRPGSGGLGVTVSVTPPLFDAMKKMPYPASEVVGVKGFEPSASWSRTKRSTKLSYTPDVCPSDIELSNTIRPSRSLQADDPKRVRVDSLFAPPRHG